MWYANIFAKKEKFRDTIFTCTCGAQMEFFDEKICRKSCDTVPLSGWSWSCHIGVKKRLDRLRNTKFLVKDR